MEPTPSAPPAVGSSKLRLMCSHGGLIVPRPHTKSLFYSGGETRIISIPTASAGTLSSFTAAVSSVLSVLAPFTLKYQLPGHDLDSLISLSSDDDLLILLDELPRFPPSSRIRLFLFPPKAARPELSQSVLCHPKTETWFIDALNSARMMQKGENCAAGFGQNESLNCVGALSGAESIVLETNSSFGSTSSSFSLTNSPSGKPQDENNGTNFQENRARLPSVDLASSDGRGPNTVLHLQAGAFKVATFETGAASSTACEPQNNSIPFPSLAPSHQTVPVSGLPVHPIQHLISAQPIYLPQQRQPVCLLPISATQPTYQLQPPIYHPTNAPYPLYIFPSNSTLAQSYGLSIQCGLAGPTSLQQPAASPLPSTQEVNDASNTGALSKNNQQQYASLHQVQQIVQSVDLDQKETSSQRSEFDDDPAQVQIYKSQPPLPTLPSQYQTMTKATTLLLSEDFTQLHTGGVRQQMKHAQPQ